MVQAYNKRWIHKGRRASIISVMEQARVHVTLARTHEAALSQRGWTAERTDALESRVSVLDGRYSERSFETDASRSAAQTERDCRDDAMRFIRNLKLVAPMVLRDHPVEGVTDDAFHFGTAFNQSSKRISQYLMHIRPFVVALETHLSPYFAGESPTARLEQVKSALDASDTHQEATRGKLPSVTLEIRAMTGEILEMIEDLIRVAKITFRDRPDIAAQFRKFIIHRAVRSAKKVEPTGTADTAASTEPAPSTDRPPEISLAM